MTETINNLRSEGRNRSPPRKSLVYKKCEEVYHNLVTQGYGEISKQDLEQLVRKYIGGSPSTMNSYLHNFVDFKFLRINPKNPNTFLVNREKFIFSPTGIDGDEIGEDASLPSSLHTCEKPRESSSNNQEHRTEDSKTRVYFRDSGPRVAFSVKVNPGMRKQYVERIKSLGLDCCYVQEAWMNAFMVATDEARNLVQTPIKIGFTTLVVNVVMPYVVSRPRRKRKHIEKEIIDEETSDF